MCSKGVPDFVKCYCITFPDDDKFTQTCDQFTNVTDSLRGQTNTDITISVNEIQQLIDDLTKYVLDNQNNLNSTYISGQITYIGKKISALTLIVNALVSVLFPNTNCPNVCKNNRFVMRESDCTCTCSLNCTFDQLNYMQDCRCLNFVGATDLYKLDQSCVDLIVEVSYNTYSASVSESFIYRLFELDDAILTHIAYCEFNALTLNSTVIAQEVLTYQNRISSISVEYYKWVDSTRSCTPKCDLTYEIIADGCHCKSSKDIDRYYELLDSFTIIEFDVIGYQGRGNKTEFIQRASDIRKLFEQVFTCFYNSSNLDKVLNLLNIIEVKTKSLTIDFENWVNSNTVCSSTVCSPSEILYMKNCTCINIVNWDKLPEVLNGLYQLEVDISKLAITSVKMQTLLNNT